MNMQFSFSREAEPTRVALRSALHHNISMQFLDCSPPGLRPSQHDALDARCHPREIPGMNCAKLNSALMAHRRLRSADVCVWMWADGQHVRGVDRPQQHGDNDETTRFYDDPMNFLLCAYGDGQVFLEETKPPSHVVVFDSMAARISQFLETWQYSQVADIFHAHLILDDRTSHRLLIFERQQT